MPRMKIGFFLDSQYPTAGGMARSAQAQVTALQALGHEVTVFCAQNSEPLPYVVRIPTKYFLQIPEGSLQHDDATAARIAAEHQLDIIHSQTERGALRLAQRVAQKLRVPYMHTFHGNACFLLDFYPFLTRLLVVGTAMVWRPVGLPRPDVPHELPGYYKKRDIIRRAAWRNMAMIAEATNYYTTPMPYLLQGLRYLVPEAKGEILPTGVDVRTFASGKRQRPADAPVRVVHFGRIVREKRVGAMLQAFLLAAAQRKNLELVMIGPGDQVGPLKKIAAASPFAKNIHITGPINDQKQLAQELADADMFVMSSYHFETQGLVLLEAAAAGLPIVYCDELLTIGVSPQNAILTKPAPESLVEGIIQLADDPNRRQAMGKASRAIAKQYSTTAVEQQLADIYQRLLNHNI